ncbi:paired box protein Pax-3-B-like isoform X2 [Montipora capricornis]|uniref:paired box protein Pax-3-B-like isoform X1 n=1 Tax=Montipora capricornis TaxID=246305 RepID=UPI0035F1DD1C
MEDSSASSSAAGPGRLNQLGGVYINGKPLPKEVRHEIISLAIQGLRPCDISRRLRITHGCISKLLSKYRKSGSIQPGGEGVGRPRVITARVAQRIRQYTQDQPGLYSWEIRDRLLHDNICSSENIPSPSSINRLLRKKDKGKTLSESRSELDSSSTYTIASILNLSSKTSKGKSLHPASSSAASCLESHVEGTYDQKKQTGSCQESSIEEIQFPLQTQERTRIKYNEQQVKELEAAFAINQYPSAAERDQLAAKIGVMESKIQVWFSNRRVKCKSPRMHTIHEMNATTNLEPKQCTCQRRYSDPPIHLLSPHIIGTGPSRIFFP